MAQPHLTPGQLGSVAPLGAAAASTPSFALVKGRQLEVMRLVLPAGKAQPECIKNRSEFEGQQMPFCARSTRTSCSDFKSEI